MTKYKLNINNIFGSHPELKGQILQYDLQMYNVSYLEGLSYKIAWVKERVNNFHKVWKCILHIAVVL